MQFQRVFNNKKKYMFIKQQNTWRKRWNKYYGAALFAYIYKNMQFYDSRKV